METLHPFSLPACARQCTPTPFMDDDDDDDDDDVYWPQAATHPLAAGPILITAIQNHCALGTEALL